MVLVLAALLCAAPAFLAAQAPSPSASPAPQKALQQAESPIPASVGRETPGEDPSLLLGLGLGEALERFGLPESMYSLRGAEAWQDDVVFQYSGGFSLFWFSGRVWQVRLSSAYRGAAYGVFAGDPPDKVVSLLGQPYASGEGSYVFNLPGRNYPVRMRAYVKDGKVADLYVYRADF